MTDELESFTIRWEQGYGYRVSKPNLDVARVVMRDDAKTRIGELEAEVERLRDRSVEYHRAITGGGGSVEDGGAWEDRAVSAEAEVARLSRRPDLSPEQCSALAFYLANWAQNPGSPNAQILAALRAAAEQESS